MIYEISYLLFIAVQHLNFKYIRENEVDEAHYPGRHGFIQSTVPANKTNACRSLRLAGFF